MSTQQDFIARAARAGYQVDPRPDGQYHVTSHNFGTPTPEQHQVQEQSFLEEMIEQHNEFIEKYGENYKPSLWSKLGDLLHLW